VVDVSDGGYKTQRVDAARVRESGGTADKRKRADGDAVAAEQTETLVGAVQVRRRSEWRRRVLHLHDDRQNGKRIGLHSRPKGGIYLLFEQQLRASE
jgi:hypothetical protein